MKRFVVYNPRSAGGRTGRKWPSIASRLERAIGGYTVAASNGPNDATRLVRSAVANGARDIIAVGGDGTINEALNGLFNEDLQLSPDVKFAFLPCGTGCDFGRTFAIGDDLGDALARLTSGHIRRIDIGRVTFLDHAGQMTVRHFGNVASFGLSGAIAYAANKARFSRLLGAKGMFYYKSLEALARYRFQRVCIEADEQPAGVYDIATIAIANGQYFGGGMHVAPAADPSDGLFDLVVVHRACKPDLVRALNLAYTGRHLHHPAVRMTRIRRLRVSPLQESSSGPVLIEIDGETPGQLPATFEVLPAALALRC